MIAVHWFCYVGMVRENNLSLTMLELTTWLWDLCDVYDHLNHQAGRGATGFNTYICGEE